jgi:hypothetical protein
VNYGFAGLVWLLGFWLAFVGVGYGFGAALILAALGAVPGALVSVWWQLPPGEPASSKFASKSRPRQVGDTPSGGSPRSRYGYGYHNLNSSRSHRQGQRGRRGGWLSQVMTRSR